MANVACRSPGFDRIIRGRFGELFCGRFVSKILPRSLRVFFVFEYFMEASLKSLRIIALLVVLASLLMTPSVRLAAAQADQISLTVTPAGDGYFKNGEWLAVWAEIENAGSDIEAQLSVQITGSSSQSTYAVDVSLPSGARKRVPLYILPNNFSRELEVQLKTQDTLLAKQKITVRPQGNITYLVGLVASERGGLALLNGITLPGQSRPKVILDLAPADIPERSEGLGSFDLLVFNDVDTSRLTPAQAEALAGWVYQGGQLVIGGGSGSGPDPFRPSNALLPVELNGQGEIRAEDLNDLVAFAGGSTIRTTGTFVCATVTPAPQARTLVEASLSPLVVEGSYGKGRVDFIGLNLSSAPFNSWPDTIAFWNRLVASLGQYPDGPAARHLHAPAGRDEHGQQPFQHSSPRPAFHPLADHLTGCVHSPGRAGQLFNLTQAAPLAAGLADNSGPDPAVFNRRVWHGLFNARDGCDHEPDRADRP